MSTQKSLLTYESVKDSIKTINTRVKGIAVPLGITPFGKVEYATLLDECEDSNMLVFGLPGSGKSKYVEFVIKSLIDRYDGNIIISYVDGKSCEIQQWKKTDGHPCRIPNPGIFEACVTPEELESVIAKLYNQVVHDELDAREIVVLDEISHLLPSCNGEAMENLDYILRNGPAVGIHFLLAHQSPSHAYEIGQDNRFGLMCTTRTTPELSELLYNNTIGSCVRRYGDIVYSYRGNQSKLRVPFVESRHWG